jgi:hypothetical protein
MHGASGRVGELLFRQINGKTVVSVYNQPGPKRTRLQQVFNDKMRLAAQHARAAMRDPATRAHYEKKKKRLNVSSAYTAACTDFLRKGQVDMVDTSKYDKGIITVKAYKADLGFESVTVSISGTDGREVAKGLAVSRGEGKWMFRTPAALPNMEDVVITVDAKDRTGNSTKAVLEHGKKLVQTHRW